MKAYKEAIKMKKLTILKIVTVSFTYLFIIACLIIALINVDLLNQYSDLVTKIIYFGVFGCALIVMCDECENGTYFDKKGGE